MSTSADIAFVLFVLLIVAMTTYVIGHRTGHIHMCNLQGFSDYDVTAQRCVGGAK